MHPAKAYDRTTGDIGNLVALEHLNLQVADQQQATAFYVMGLGLTRDPYLFTGVEFMWINAGANQFHLITGPAQVIAGRVGLVVPDPAGLLRRLEAVRPFLRNSRFDFTAAEDRVDVTCPWGNCFRVHAPGTPQAAGLELGLPYLEFEVPVGAAPGVAAFYRELLGAFATTAGPSAKVSVGLNQSLHFVETAEPIRPFDGHHIQVYVHDFSGPHRRLLERGLVTEESNAHQYRFDTLVDPVSGAPLCRLEHEVRSLRHPLYARPLVNRNAMQSSTAYVPGRDAWTPSAPPAESDDPALKVLRARYLDWLAKGER